MANEGCSPEELMAERSVTVTYETVRAWCYKFLQYLWRAGDQNGSVLDFLVQSLRDKKAAALFFEKLLLGPRYSPRVGITDRLASYSAVR
jgi:putative transposase